jgi:hypothetical protein
MNHAMMSYAKTIWDAAQGNRGIAWGVWWNVGLLAASLAAMPFDGRKILGLNPWVKPVKFDVSVILFLVTMAVLMKALGDGPEWTAMRVWMGWGFGVAMIVEDTVIALQSARGVRSHMNFDTGLDSGLFAVMGVGIVVSTLLSAWLLVSWCRTDAGLAQAEVWGIRLGLLMLLAASMEGVRMVGHGSHTVGWRAGAGVCELEYGAWRPAGGALLCAACAADLSGGGDGAGEDAGEKRDAGRGLVWVCGGVWVGGVVDVCGGDEGNSGGAVLERDGVAAGRQRQRREPRR